MNFIFICSYLSVPCAIETIERESDDFRVLTANTKVIELFSELYSPESVIKLPRLFRSFGDIRAILVDIVKLPLHKHRILKLCRKLNPDKIFFYYLGWNGFESWLIKSLSKSTRVFYRLKVSLDNIEPNNSFKLRFKTRLVRVLFNIPVKARNFHGHPMMIVDKEFLTQINAEPYTTKHGAELVSKFIDRKYDEYKRVKILVLLGKEINLDVSAYHGILNQVYDIILKKYHAEEIGIKLHPDAIHTDIPCPENSVLVTQHLSAGLLCHKCDAVISYASATLYEADNIGVKAISLVNMVPATKAGQAENYRAYLEKNSLNNNIAFPNTLKELEMALNGLQKQ